MGEVKAFVKFSLKVLLALGAIATIESIVPVVGPMVRNVRQNGLLGVMGSPKA